MLAAVGLVLAVVHQLPWLLGLLDPYFLLGAYVLWVIGWVLSVVGLALALAGVIGARLDASPGRRALTWVLAGLVPVVVIAGWVLTELVFLRIGLPPV